MLSSFEKRGRLEDVWDALADDASLRKALRDAEASARIPVSYGSVKSTAGNGHQVEFAQHGPGQVTQLEIAEGYRWLVDLFDTSFTFLSRCCQFGLDAFQVEQGVSIFSTTTPANSAIIVDETGIWLIQCSQFNLDSVVGSAVSDEAVFIWMMYHIVQCTEASSDYTLMRVGGVVP